MPNNISKIICGSVTRSPPISFTFASFNSIYRLLSIFPSIPLDVMGAADDVWMIHSARNTPMAAERGTSLTITATHQTLIPQRLDVITATFPPIIGVFASNWCAMFDKNETGRLIREWQNLPYFYYVNFAIYGSRWKRFVPRWGARSSKPVRGVRRPWWVRLPLFSASFPDPCQTAPTGIAF